MIVDHHRKQPSETYPIGMTFADRLQTGETVNSQAITSKNILTQADSSAALLQSPAINGAILEVRLKAGLTHGEDHRVQFKAGTTLGNSYEDEVDVNIRED